MLFNGMSAFPESGHSINQNNTVLAGANQPTLDLCRFDCEPALILPHVIRTARSDLFRRACGFQQQLDFLSLRMRQSRPATMMLS